MGNNSGSNSFGDVLVGFLGILLAVPLFFIAHRHVPQFDLPYHLDRIALFILIVLLLLLVLRLFKTIITIAFVGLAGWLTYGSFTGKYGFENLYSDARAFFYSFQNDPNAETLSITVIKEKLFPAESKGHDLHYHEDKDGIWLNLDYTQHYPGGDFMAEPVLGILYP